MGDWGVSLRSPTPEDLPKRSTGQDNSTAGRADRVATEDLASLSTERNFLLDELDLSRRQDAKAFNPDPFALTKIRAAFKTDHADKSNRGLTGFFAADTSHDTTRNRSPARVGLRPAENAGAEQAQVTGGNGKKAGSNGVPTGNEKGIGQHIKGLVPASKVDNFGNQAQPDALAGDEADEMGRKRHTGWIGLDGKPLPAKRAKGDASAGSVRHIPGRGVVASVIGNTTAPSTYKPPLSAVEKVEKRKAAKRAKDAEKAKAKAEKEAKKAKASLIAALDKTPKGSRAKGKKQAAGKGKKKKADTEEENEEEDDATAGRKAKKSKDDEPPKFRRIPKDAAPTDEFPIVQGLERQKSLPSKKRNKTKGSPLLSPFPLSMPSTEASGGRLDLDKLFDGLAGKAASMPATKVDPAGENPKDDLDELDSDSGSVVGNPEEHLGKSLVLQRFLRSDTPPLVVIEEELEIPLGDSANPIPIDEEIVTPRTAGHGDQPSTISQLTSDPSLPNGHAATSSSQVPYSSPLAGKTTGTGEQLIMQPKPFKHSDDRALTALVGFNGSLETACATARERSQALTKPAPPPDAAKGPIPDVYNHKGFYSSDVKRKGKAENIFSTLPAKKSKSRSTATTTESYRHPLLSSAWTPSTPSTSASESIRSSGKFNLPLAPFRKPPSSAYVQPPRLTQEPQTPQAKEVDSETGSYTRLTMFKASAPKPVTNSEAQSRFTVETIRGSQYAGSDLTRLDVPVRFRGDQASRFAPSKAALDKNPLSTHEAASITPYGRSTYVQKAQEAVEQSQVQRDEEWETSWTRNTAATARRSLGPPLSVAVNPWSKDRSISPQRHNGAPASSSRTQALDCDPESWGMNDDLRLPQVPTRNWQGQQMTGLPAQSNEWRHSNGKSLDSVQNYYPERRSLPLNAYTDRFNTDRSPMPMSYY